MKIEWELVQDNDSCDDYEFWRTPVPSGWLVTTETDKFKWGTLTFVPDPTHSWGKTETKKEDCPACGGFRDKLNSAGVPVKCEACNGTGEVPR